MTDSPPSREQPSPTAPQAASFHLALAEKTAPLISLSPATATYSAPVVDAADKTTTPILDRGDAPPTAPPGFKPPYALTIVSLAFSISTLGLGSATLLAPSFVLPGYRLPGRAEDEILLVVFLVNRLFQSPCCCYTHSALRA